MELIQIWEGYKGRDGSEFVTIEFRGKEIGSWRTLYGEYDEDRGTTVRVFSTEDNTVLVHRYEWSNHDGGEHEAYVYEYESIEQAAAEGWQRLFEDIGLLPREKISLKEWRERKKQKK